MLPSAAQNMLKPTHTGVSLGGISSLVSTHIFPFPAFRSHSLPPAPSQPPVARVTGASRRRSRDRHSGPSRPTSPRKRLKESAYTLALESSLLPLRSCSSPAQGSSSRGSRGGRGFGEDWSRTSRCSRSIAVMSCRGELSVSGALGREEVDE